MKTTTKTTKTTKLAADLLAIAKANVTGLETLDTRKSDSLDFREVAVWEIKALVEAAYAAGLAAGKKAGK